MSWNPFAAKKMPTPSTDWWNEGVSEFTPDITTLERREYQRVFICDEMMKDHHKHRMLGEDLIKTGVHAFTEGKYSLVRKNLGKVSPVIPLELHLHAVPHARIRSVLI